MFGASGGGLSQTKYEELLYDIESEVMRKVRALIPNAVDYGPLFAQLNTRITNIEVQLSSAMAKIVQIETVALPGLANAIDTISTEL